VVKISKTRRAAIMKGRRVEKRNPKDENGLFVRASISFPPALYATLEQLAKQKKVSLAWVVRDAAEKYCSEQALAPAKAR
jgi:hypothetical protein